ncbi:MAG: hypothetical protein IPK28_09550 [Devosia sp.]|nr:hypothetical protein [Devosia sp.]
MDAIGRFGPLRRALAPAARLREVAAPSGTAGSTARFRQHPEPARASVAALERMHQPTEVVEALAAYRRVSESAVRRMPAGYRTSKLV